MTAALPALAFVLVLGGCSSPRAAAPPEEGAARLLLGSRYEKSSYVTAGGDEVTAFRREISNHGTAPGRAAGPACSVVVAGRRLPLVIFENPVLEPGERGWLRAGGELPALGHAAFDDLEPRCVL